MRRTFLDPERQARFAHAGYEVVPMLSAGEVDRLVAAVGQLHPADGFDPANDATAMVSYHCSFLDHDIDYKRRAHDLISETFAPFLTRYLAGYRILDGNFYVKPPGTGEFSIHQNWPCITDLDDTTVTIWVPLVDVVEANGALQVVEGSHKILPHVEAPGADAYFDGFRPALVDEYLVPVPMTAGQGMIFDDSLIHWSARNDSDDRRIAVQITCIPGDSTPAFFAKNGDDRFELIAADTDFYLEQDVSEVYARQPAWTGLGFVPNRNRPIDVREFAWLMAHRDEIRAAGHDAVIGRYAPAAPVATAVARRLPRFQHRVQRVLASIGR